MNKAAATSPLTPPADVVVAGPARAAWLWARVSLALWRHGAWLPLVMLLVAAAAGVAWLAAQQRLAAQAAARQQSNSAASAPARTTEPHPDTVAREALWQVLPPATQAAAQVRRLVAATHEGLAWKSAEFHYTDDARLGVTRLQITLPTQGRYFELRQALDRALREMPNLSLDQLMIRRQAPGQGPIESRLRLSIWMRDSGPQAPASGAGAR